MNEMHENKTGGSIWFVRWKTINIFKGGFKLKAGLTSTIVVSNFTLHQQI